MLNIFSWTWWPLLCLLLRNVYSGFCPFFIGLLFSLLLSCLISLYILDLTPYKMYYMQILSLIIADCPSLHWLFLCCAEASYFNIIPFVDFCFLEILSKKKKITAYTNVLMCFSQHFLLIFSSLVFDPFWVYFCLWWEIGITFFSSFSTTIYLKGCPVTTVCCEHFVRNRLVVDVWIQKDRVE
jgi:hypothetical protein